MARLAASAAFWAAQEFLFDFLLIAHVQDEAQALGGLGIERGHAHHHRDPAAVFADVLLLPRVAVPGFGQLLDGVLIERAVFRRCHLIPANQTALQIGPRITHDLQKGVVAFGHQPRGRSHHDPDDVGIDEPAEAVLAALEGVLGFALAGDVPRNAQSARDVSRPVVQRDLGRGGPGLVPVGPDQFFFHPHQGLPGFEDLLFVPAGFLGVLLGKEIKIGFAHRLFGPQQTGALGLGSAHAEIPAVTVFEVDIVGNIAEQTFQHIVRANAGGLFIRVFFNNGFHGQRNRDNRFRWRLGRRFLFLFFVFGQEQVLEPRCQHRGDPDGEQRQELIGEDIARGRAGMPQSVADQQQHRAATGDGNRKPADAGAKRHGHRQDVPHPRRDLHRQ